MKKKILRQIIAFGGGGFSDQPYNLPLDEYILKTGGKSKLKILFLPAAGGDSKEYVSKFNKTCRRLMC